MSAVCVVDCSIALTWLFEDEATPPTDEILWRLKTEAAVVPSLWFLEITNSLYFAERKGRVSTDKVAAYLTLVSGLILTVDTASSERAFDDLLPLCRTHNLTSYDAAYLDLSIRTGLPLATLDEPLRKAAAACGVTLLGK